MSTDFLPVSRKDMEERGIEQLDFVYVIGDAYVDHPSFGHAIISRLLEAHGFRVGIISQPDWKDEKSISILGKPSWISGVGRKHGFHGQPLYGFQEKKTERCLHTGRCDGKTPGQCYDRLLQPDSPHLQAYPDHHWWDRGESSQTRPL